MPNQILRSRCARLGGAYTVDCYPSYCFPSFWVGLYFFASRFFVTLKIPWWRFTWSYGRLSCRFSTSRLYGCFFWLWFLFNGLFESTLIAGCHAVGLSNAAPPLLLHLQNLDADSLLSTKFPPSGFDSRLGLTDHLISLSPTSCSALHHGFFSFASSTDPLRLPFISSRHWGENGKRKIKRPFEALYRSYLHGLDDDSLTNLFLMQCLTPVDNSSFWDPILWTHLSDTFGFDTSEDDTPQFTKTRWQRLYS